jgi:formylglycine-generating enzyme required for sulfatase activity
MMGSDDRWAYPADGEAPVREISLDSFWIDPVAVSNGTFASLHRGDRIRDRGGAIRVVVRLRRATA